MARPSLPAAEVIANPVPAGRLQADRKALNQLAAMESEAELRTHDLARKLGYEGSLDPDILEMGVEQTGRDAAERLLIHGRMLLLLKERVGHGAFLARIAKRGIAPRIAQKCMQAALKFSNAPSKAHLIQAVGNPTKLLELVVLDEGDIQQLGEEGWVGDIKVDDIESMSVSELRAAVAEHRQTIKAKERLITKRDERIAAQDERLERPYVPNEKSAARSAAEQAMLDELGVCTAGFEQVMLRTTSLCDDIFSSAVSQTLELRARQEVVYMVQFLAELLYTHNIQITPEEITLRPSYMRELDAALEAKGTSIAQVVEEREARREAARKEKKAAKRAAAPA